jgi:hypothetical protein
MVCFPAWRAAAGAGRNIHRIVRSTNHELLILSARPIHYTRQRFFHAMAASIAAIAGRTLTTIKTGLMQRVAA